MKKFILLLLTLSITVFMCSCGGSSSAKNVESLEALSEAANGAIIQPADVNISDEEYLLFEDDVNTAKYCFTVDGVQCALYFADKGMDEEICTIDHDSIFGDSQEENHYIENDALKAQRWFTVDGQYIFIAEDSSAWDWNQFDKVQSQFGNMKPLNWNSEVSFEDYKAIEGTYADKDNNMASISIRQDHVVIYAYMRGENNDTICYEMDAVLDGDTLKYEKEIISKSSYNEETGQSEEENIGEEGAGSIKIDGRTLNFDNPASKELKGLILKPY